MVTEEADQVDTRGAHPQVEVLEKPAGSDRAARVRGKVQERDLLVVKVQERDLLVVVVVKVQERENLLAVVKVLGKALRPSVKN